jgi:hypothetical protein
MTSFSNRNWLFDGSSLTGDLWEISLTTDKDDYAPGETATISASGFEVGGTVEFQVLHVSDPGVDGVYATYDDLLDAGLDGIAGTADDGFGPLNNTEDHDAFYVTDGVLITLDVGADGVEGTEDDIVFGDLDGIANGTIVSGWYVNSDDSIDERFIITALEVEAGGDGEFGTGDDSTPVGSTQARTGFSARPMTSKRAPLLRPSPTPAAPRRLMSSFTLWAANSTSMRRHWATNPRLRWRALRTATLSWDGSTRMTRILHSASSTKPAP